MKIRIHVQLLCCLILFFSCTKDSAVTPDPNPTKIVIHDPLSSSYRGVTLSAEILYINSTEAVLEHGFLIWGGDDFDYGEKTFPISGAPKPGAVIYTLPDVAAFKDEKSYDFYYYIKTASGRTLSPPRSMTFSRVVADVKTGLFSRVGETIQIDGDFSGIENEYMLFLDRDPEKEIPYEVINANRTIRFKVPEKNYHGVHIYFRLRRREAPLDAPSIYIAQTMVLGTIHPPTKYKLYLDDNIDATSIDYQYGLHGDVKLFVGENFITFHPLLTLGQFIRNQQGSTFPIGYTNGRDTVVFPEKISLILPDENTFNCPHPFVHPNSTFTIEGFYMEKFGGNAYVGGKSAFIYVDSWPTNTYDCSIGNVEDGSYPLIVHSNNFNYRSVNQIKVQSLQLSGLTPAQVSRGSKVVLKGNFVICQTYSISIDDTTVGTAVCQQSGVLDFIIGGNQKTGPVDIRVSYSSRSSNSRTYAPQRLSLQIL